MADAIVSQEQPVTTRAEARARRDAARAAGLGHYFTGMPCNSGHICNRRVSNGKCVECGLEEFREWSKQNPERVRARTKKWRDANPDWVKNYQREWAKENKDRLSEAAKQWRADNRETLLQQKKDDYLKNREKRLAQSREWQRNNPEKVIARNLRWVKANPEAAKAITHRRRAKKAGTEGFYTAADVARMIERQQGLCNGCILPLPKNYHVDHVTPLSRGGSNWPTNLQLLCPTCNTSKGSKTMDEWVDRKKRDDDDNDSRTDYQRGGHHSASLF